MKRKKQNIDFLFYNQPELQFIVNVLSNNKSSLSIFQENKLNQKEFIRLIRYHRLDSIFYKVMQEQNITLPKELKVQLERLNIRNKMRMMKLTAELIRLHKLFTENDIEYISLKGPALSQQIYGDYTIRSPRDLDVLVREKDLEMIFKILLRNGYLPKNTKYEKLIKFNHDVSFYSKENGVNIEIHKSLFPFKSLNNKFNIDNEFQSKNSIYINNTFVNILTEYSQKFFIELHTIKHKWELLYWVADLSMINPPEKINYFNNFVQFHDKTKINYFYYLFTIDKSYSHKIDTFKYLLKRLFFKFN